MQSSPKWRCNFLHFYLQLLVFLLCNKQTAGAVWNEPEKVFREDGDCPEQHKRLEEEEDKPCEREDPDHLQCTGYVALKAAGRN